MNLITSLINRLFPICPRGGHRQVGKMTVNVKGNSFCLHDDCIAANFKDLEDLPCSVKCFPTLTCQKTKTPVPCDA